MNKSLLLLNLGLLFVRLFNACYSNKPNGEYMAQFFWC
jgi:hypothetical protein